MDTTGKKKKEVSAGKSGFVCGLSAAEWGELENWIFNQLQKAKLGLSPIKKITLAAWMMEFGDKHDLPAMYRFLKWGQQAFENFSVVPPDTGICHQVNLEYLAQTVWTKKEKVKITDK